MSQPDPLFDTTGDLDPSHVEPISKPDVRRSIDDLVDEAHRYRTSKEYAALLEFVAGFRRYSPFNALLVHIQRPGARFVASAGDWRAKYGRRVRPGEQPLIALQPFGPVMFVYDVSQTEPEPGADMIPEEVAAPFSMPPILGVQEALARTTEWAKRDGVRTSEAHSGSQSAGCIRRAQSGPVQSVLVKRRPPERRDVPIRYEIGVNSSFAPTEKFATVAHELGHLYCGHVGTPNPKWWPFRPGLPQPVREFEAETVAYLACQRLDANVRMPVYLHQYLEREAEVPTGTSLERIMWGAGQVISMAEGTAKPRKE